MSQCRAAQVAIEPLSQVSTASSEASSSRTPTTYCGAIGSRPLSSSASMFARQRCIRFWHFSRNEVSLRGLSIGSSACSVCFASPTTGTSVATLAPARAGSASIWATRTLPGAGRCLV